MHDHIVRATAPGLRAFAAVTTNLTDEARRRHNCYPVAAAALGRTMTAALLLATNLKAEESITIRIAGDGPLGEIVADASARGTVRGYVKKPQIDLPLREGKLDVGRAVGAGNIFVTRFTGLKQPFTGSSPLVSGEIAEDVTNYLLTSEQTPSSVALGVLVGTDYTVQAAGGFLVQALPGAADEVIDKLERNLASLKPVSHLISSGYGAADILEKVFAGFSINLYEPKKVTFHCPCSRERVDRLLISLGEQELTDMIGEGRAELVCHFCSEKYHFNRQELENILQRIKQGAT
ncbi:Hsp33 family molecular chaperone HslO [Sporolituus thermophilus]|uniref:33 kDa chaperonin n=1 Tax=Sporolituus thermophilus DSM 23256 TaxID=1123285 RepID=A0A1G7KTP0_9FIRM|nr:Hsp33 family molecular chaperone HslO [Sporolituus thermophilus]SDF40575.1 molecular chaperone Hsp33 [Sporolituus thermophilus DSM 23256]